MMDVNALSQLIGSMGFPIVACGAMFWYMTKLEKAHKEETDALRTALEQNTLAITKLADKLEEGSAK